MIIASSFCTVDNENAKHFEPNADAPSVRMAILGRLKKEGFFTGAHFIPLLPNISDTDELLERSVRMVKENNLDYLFAGSLTLFGSENADSKTLVLTIIERYYPEQLKRYTATFAQKDYVSTNYQLVLDKKVKD